jgi:hypothetical protein
MAFTDVFVFAFQGMEGRARVYWVCCLNGKRRDVLHFSGFLFFVQCARVRGSREIIRILYVVFFQRVPCPQGRDDQPARFKEGQMISTASIGLYDKFTGTVAAGEMKDMKRKNVHGAGTDP